MSGCPTFEVSLGTRRPGPQMLGAIFQHHSPGQRAGREAHGVSRQMGLNLSLETSVFSSVEWGEEQHPSRRAGGQFRESRSHEPQTQTPGRSSDAAGVRAASDPRKGDDSLTHYPTDAKGVFNNMYRLLSLICLSPHTVCPQG